MLSQQRFCCSSTNYFIRMCWLLSLFQLVARFGGDWIVVLLTQGKWVYKDVMTSFSLCQTHHSTHLSGDRIVVLLTQGKWVHTDVMTSHSLYQTQHCTYRRKKKVKSFSAQTLLSVTKSKERNREALSKKNGFIIMLGLLHLFLRHNTWNSKQKYWN